jgi:hypothetical protein
MSRPRFPSGGRLSHDLPEVRRYSHGSPEAGDAVMTRPRQPRSHGLPEGGLGRETQTRLARGNLAVTTRPSVASGGRCGHGSSEATVGLEMQSRLPQGQPRRENGVTMPEAISGQEMQSRLARGHLRAGDVVTSRLRPPLGGRRSHTSPDANLGHETQSWLAR